HLSLRIGGNRMTQITVVREVTEKAKLAKEAAGLMNRLTTDEKNDALHKMEDAIVREREAIITANKSDLKRGRANGTSASLLDRLALDDARIEGIAEGLRQIASLPDPVGDVLETFERPNGLRVEKIRVPLGVIGMIYEARPNVTVDAAGLCLKTGNPVVLRGGSAAIDSNRMIVEVLHRALADTAMPPEALQLIEDSDRKSVDAMLKLNGLLDVVIPRGGAALIRNVVENATVPVIETGAGICHTFVDETADPHMAAEIALNAKAQRPSVCNAMETLLIDRGFAAQHLTMLIAPLQAASVELRGCQEMRKLIPSVIPATDDDYATEYNDYVLNIRIVDGLDEALRHIARFGTKHSECIVTENAANARRFLHEVDAAAVYHNA